MSMKKSESPRPRPRLNWFAIAAALLVGVVGLIAGIWSGRPGVGAMFLCIMAATAAFLVIASRRSDTVALLGDDVHEERNVHIHRRAALITLNILAAVIVGGLLIDIARGGDGDPYAFLGFVGGVTYVVCLIVLNRRT